MKEKLENFWSQCNIEIKNNEKIQKGIYNLKKTETNIIKTLNYVSKVNKMKKDNKKLFQKLMKSLKFSFVEKDSKINFEEYYFNGI